MESDHIPPIVVYSPSFQDSGSVQKQEESKKRRPIVKLPGPEAYATPKSCHVKYLQLCIAVYSLKEVKCIAFIGDDCRCDTFIIQEKVKIANSLLKWLPTTVNDFDRVLNLMLCDDHNVLHIRSSYIR